MKMKYIVLRKLSDLFWVVSPNLFFASLILSLMTGLCYSLLIPFLIYAVASDTESEKSLALHDYSFFFSPTSNLALVFLFMCIAIITVRTVSMTMSTYLASKASSLHRLTLYKRIKNLSILQLDQIGHANLINLINIDVPRTTHAAMDIPVIWSAAVTIFGTLAYLLYLDARIFMFVCFSLGIGVVTYYVPSYFAGRYFQQYREKSDKIQKGFMGLVNGAKELKLNKTLSNKFYFEEIVEPEQLALSAQLKSSFLFVLSENYGSMISFFVIAIVVFHFPYVYELEPTEMFGILMILIYLTGPVSLILNAMNNVRQGRISLKNIKKYYPMLHSDDESGSDCICNNWSLIKIEDVGFNYPAGFSIKSINFELTLGEIVFITGGNGSGKSTLSKCLSMHYLPTEGAIFFGDQKISPKNVTSARQFISAIYSDFYLFEKVYDYDFSGDSKTVIEYLELLQLENVVSINHGSFNTTKLSTGQRKRLALLVLLLEDRPICIFDEWAADQDPVFKEIFYSHILDLLKKKNKLVIVISHDDRYFHCADRVLLMEGGQLKNIIRNNAL
jgi:putative pyoverdin transport system ATP-binding/permease protein